MLKSNINMYLRILCMFLVVVMVSVTFMQPIAYAYAVAVEALILLVGALLMTCGISFSSPEQLHSSALYCINNMPTFLTNQLSDAILDCSLDVTKLYQAMKNGITSVVQVNSDVYAQFKAWVIEAFQINDAAVNDGLLYSEIAGVGRYLGSQPICTVEDSYNNSNGGSKGFDKNDAVVSNTYLMSWPGSFTYGDIKFTSSANSSDAFVLLRNGIVVGAAGTLLASGVTWALVYLKDSGDSYIHFRLVSTHPSGNAATLNKKFVWDISTGIRYSQAQTAPPLKLSKPAFDYSLYDSMTEINVGLPDTADKLIGRDWTDVLTNWDGIDRYLDPADTWEWQEALDKMREQLENVSDLLNSAEYAQMLEGISSIVGSLQGLQDAMAQNIDVINDIRALSDALASTDALLEAVKDLVRERELADSDIAQGIDDLIKAREDDAAKIDDIEKDIEEIKDLIKGTTGSNEPVKINWTILTSIAVFDKFPFSLPKDVYLFFSLLAAPPVEPVFVVDIFGGKFGETGKITLDFKMFEKYRVLVRNCVFVSLVVGLIGATKTYIWSGGG